MPKKIADCTSVADCKIYAAHHGDRAAIARRSAIDRAYELGQANPKVPAPEPEPEPVDFTARVTCPCCGSGLVVEHKEIAHD